MINRVVRGWLGDKVLPPMPDFSKFIVNQTGRGRRFYRMSDLTHWNSAFSAFGLHPEKLEPVYQNFYGNHFEDGAFTSEHTDSSPQGFVHVRCNVLLKKPESGGLPKVGDNVLNVIVGDLWIVFASEEVHGSTPIKGGDRLIYSFGALVKKYEYERVYGTT